MRTRVWIALVSVLAAVSAVRAGDIATTAQALVEAAPANTNTIAGADGWLFFVPELRHIGAGPFWGESAVAASQAAKPEHADPLPAIVDFKAQLARAGIELWVVPVPAKAAVYPEKIFGADMNDGAVRIDVQEQRFFSLLREHGVEVIDLQPVLVAAKAHGQMYCRNDTHWSGAACGVVAEVLAERMRATDWFAGIPKQEFASEMRRVSIVGDLRNGATTPDAGDEMLDLRFVGVERGGNLDPVPSDPASPVILLGDSHSLVFHGGGDMHATGAGLPDQIALATGIAVDLVAVRGSGATPARVNLLRRARQPGYLEGKRVVIWCFTVREFTQSSGWVSVPIVR